MEAISFRLQAFEGPLDLLLHLIEKNKVSIYDIPIAMITDQYLEYVAQMPGEDLDVMSDFLVMAATLIDIKSKMLLPAEKNEEGEEIDPREELVQRLLEYKTYKFMAAQLEDFQDDAGLVWFRKEEIPDEVRKYRAPVDPDDLLADVTLAALHAVFTDVMKRQEDRTDPIRSTFGQIEKEQVDSSQIMQNVRRRIGGQKKCTFRSLLEQGHGRMYVVVTFLSVLELMKLGRIEVKQDDTFGEIFIEEKDASEWNEEDAQTALDDLE